MKMPKKILMPIDFSAVTQNAVRHANSILQEHSAEVVLVYVNTPEKKMQEQDIQRTFRNFENDSLKDAAFYYKFEVLNGSLLSMLANATVNHKPDYVIMGLKERVPDIALATELMRLRDKSNSLLSN